MSASSDLDPRRIPTDQFGLLLSRSAEQRCREFRYRFAQAMIFGLPVLGLQLWGRSLAGSAIEADRWVSLLQAILSGWVAYVAAAGMLAEGTLILLSRQRLPWPVSLRADWLVALLAASLYLYSAIAVIGIFFIGRTFYRPILFDWVILMLAGWCGLRWIWLHRTGTNSP